MNAALSRMAQIPGIAEIQGGVEFPQFPQLPQPGGGRFQNLTALTRRPLGRPVNSSGNNPKE